MRATVADPLLTLPKNQYVKALAKVISENDVKSDLSEMVNSRFR